MKRKKSLYQKLTRISRSKQKTEKPVYQMARGIEAQIDYHPLLEDWGKLPEDGFPSNWGKWGKICKLITAYSITRHQLFDLTKVCEALQVAVSQSPPSNKRRRRRKVSSVST